MRPGRLFGPLFRELQADQSSAGVQLDHDGCSTMRRSAFPVPFVAGPSVS